MSSIQSLDFWTALQQFRKETDLTDFNEDVFLNLRNKRIG